MKKIFTICLIFINLLTNAQGWTWHTGNLNTVNHDGDWNSAGVEANAFPSSRRGFSYWKDNSNNLWVFGGEFSSDGSTNNGSLSTIAGVYWSDLWRYNPSTSKWTWVKGPSGPNGVATYGTKGVGSINNNPGSRIGAACAVDANGDFWMYGGIGYTTTAAYDRLGDLWKYTISNNTWTWMGGSSTWAAPNWGTIGTPSATVEPGSRNDANMWIVGNTIYIHGGLRTYNGVFGYTASDDLFSFNTTTNQFTYLKGSQANRTAMVSGTESVEAGTNTPGSRFGATYFKDNSNNLWLFGGKRVTDQFDIGYANDLWRYNTTTNNWTFVRGLTTTNNLGTYGTINVAAATNMPRTRFQAFGGFLGNNLIFIFGGESTNNTITLNDGWLYNGVTNNWTWVTGTSSTNNNTSANGIPFQFASTTHSPQGITNGGSYVTPDGNFWFMGGRGHGNFSAGFKSTVWRFSSSTIVLPATLSSFTARLQGNIASLNWQTSQEINTSNFEVEYSVDGTSFNKIASVLASGNSNGTKAYSATHSIGNASFHYYRLKMIDKDGKYTYSQVINLHSKLTKGVQLQVLGNQVISNVVLNITAEKATNATLIIRNAGGQVLQQSARQALVAGTNSFSYTVANYAAGIYFIELVTDANERITAKFVKQ